MPQEVYNASETDVFWSCMLNYTLAGGDELPAVGFKKVKDRLAKLTSLW